MKHLFIDETSDANNTNYLGICAALIDTSKYGELKHEYLTIMSEFGWDPSVEFKGTMIYSQSQGCQSVLVEKRIELTKNIIGMNKSTSNSRVKFCYASSTSGSTAESYLNLVQIVTSKALEAGTTSKNGKNIVSIHCDERTDVTAKDIRTVIDPILERKNLVLFEDVNLSKSSVQTMGVCLADIVGYLMSRKENLSVGRGDLDNIDPVAAKTNGQIRKLLASKEILETIKNMRVIPVIGTIDSEANGVIKLTIPKKKMAS